MIDYPDTAGWKGIDTSHDAATSMAPYLGRLQDMTLAAIEAAGVDGLTAHEAASVLDMDRTAIQPRISELHCMGLIADSDRRRCNASGCAAVVWVSGKSIFHN